MDEKWFICHIRQVSVSDMGVWCTLGFGGVGVPRRFGVNIVGVWAGAAIVGVRAGDVLVALAQTLTLLLGCVEGAVHGCWLACGFAALCAGVSADAGSANGVSALL